MAGREHHHQLAPRPAIPFGLGITHYDDPPPDFIAMVDDSLHADGSDGHIERRVEELHLAGQDRHRANMVSARMFGTLP